MASRRESFSLRSIRVLAQAEADPGFALLQPERDLRMLLTFLDRFQHLGWLPPIDVEKRALLAVHDVTIHVISDLECSYEFLSKGARGERQPWITVCFHVDGRTRIVRVCGVVEAAQVERTRTLILTTMRDRVERLVRALRRQRRG